MKPSSSPAKRTCSLIQATSTVLIASAAFGACGIYNDSLLQDVDDDNDSLGGAQPGTGGNGQSGGSGSGGRNSGGSGGTEGTGGDSASGGLGGDTGSGGHDPGEARLEIIDDLEDNDPNIFPIKMRNGRWNIYASTGEEPPEPGADFTKMTSVNSNPPHDESIYAAYMKSGEHSDFGAVLNVTMRSWPNYEQTPTYDASGYTGLNFYARVGSGSSRALRVRLVTADTDPRGGECATEGDVSELCFDHYLYPVTLKESWQRYEISFEDFGQTGAGEQFDELALDRLYTIEFHMPGSADFELWVDDLSFVLPE